MATQDRNDITPSVAADTRDTLLTVSPEAATRSIADASEHLNDAFRGAYALEGIIRVLSAADAEAENESPKQHLDGYTRGGLLEAAARLASMVQTDLLGVANLPAVGRA